MLRILLAASLVSVTGTFAGALVPGHTARVADCNDGGTAPLGAALHAPGGSVMFAAAPARDSSLLALYDRGEAFSDFLENTRRRREGWHKINDSVQIADSSLTRARAAGGSFKLLVVAIDACGDSMQQLPYVARLAELVPGLVLRIVPPAVGASVQQTHRSLDGRTATPTFVLLDEQGRDVGCVVEHPRALRNWVKANRDAMSSTALHEYMATWYAGDRGAGIVHEVVELMEKARAGTPVCERGDVRSDGAF